MKTIEQYEAEIIAKAEVIKSQLVTFEENLGNISSLIGKDPTQVYQTLVERFNETMETYRLTTRKNAEILQGYVDTLDKILAVLAEVMKAIDELESGDEELLDARIDVDSLMEKANEMMSNFDEMLGPEMKAFFSSGTMKYALVGGLSYLVMRLLRIPRILSAAGAVGAAYYIKSETEKPGEAKNSPEQIPGGIVPPEQE